MHVRVADHIFQHLADYGIRHVFLVTGGGAMHLNDALGREKRIRYVCTHHEQAGAMAAEAYARVTGKPGVLSVTTGPGGINALTGVFGAWTDSIPLLVISGQVKRETCMASYESPGLRQLGDQEVDIVALARPLTKYAVLVTEPASIGYHLDRALHLATTGRPGPCWIDVPIDVQGTSVDPERLQTYDAEEDCPPPNPAGLAQVCRDVIGRIRSASRPVLLVGSGVRLAGAEEVFDRVIGRLAIPVTTAWTAHDLVASDNPLLCGRPGTVGDRPGNFTVQNSDLLLVLGSRLNIRQVSYNWQSFARFAFKIQVDADPAELAKPTVKPDLPVLSDLRLFLLEMERQLDAVGYRPGRHSEWLRWCRERVHRYPVVLERHRRPGVLINPYHFAEVLFERLRSDEVVVCGDGAACVVPFQAAYIKRGQRMFTNSGAAAMGYDLPAAVGAAVAREGGRVICLAGDGSIQLNVQELQTVVHHQLPVKIFVLNNGGYLSIRSTQLNFFPDNLVGEGPASGVSFPDMVKVASAYGIDAFRIEGPDFGAAIDRALESAGPVLCEVMLDPDQQFEPKLSSRQLSDGRIVSPALEDLAPFLDREELEDNLLVPASQD